MDVRPELGSDEFWAQLSTTPEHLAAAICMVDVANLDQTLERHPPLRAWVNAAVVMAKIELDRAKWEETKARARAMLRVKEVDDSTPDKKKAAPVEAPRPTTTRHPSGERQNKRQSALADNLKKWLAGKQGREE